MKINIDDTKFLTSDDISHKDILVIESEGKWQESARFKKEDGTPQNEFRINFKISSGEVRNTTLSWTNVKLLVKAFSDETSDWVGKEIRAWKTKSEKAKSGFTFVYVPVDWERDDTGEWIIPDTKIEVSQTDKFVNDVEYPADEPNPADIPW
jgi:hypothetical protein